MRETGTDTATDADFEAAGERIAALLAAATGGRAPELSQRLPQELGER